MLWTLFAEENQDASLFLGKDLIVYLVLAFGAALVAGNLAAILRPPQRPDATPRRGRATNPKDAGKDDDRLAQAPVGRSLAMAGVGLVAAIWALVSLITK